MHRLAFVLALATVLVSIGLAAPASAAPLSSAAAVRAAAENLSPIAHVACWGFGWRGWGIYPDWRPVCSGYAPAYPPVYAAPAFPAPANRCWVAPTATNPGYWAAC